MAKKSPQLPVGPLADLMQWWTEAGVKGMLIGGLAVALTGRPRTTRDVDAVVLIGDDDLAQFLKLGKSCSFFPRIKNVLAMARQARVLLLRHKKTNIDIDISLAGLDFERAAIAHCNLIHVGKVAVPVARPEDLIIMKAVANRPTDWADISGLLQAHPSMDLARVCKQVDEFAQMLDMPEIYTELDRLISLRPKPRRKKNS